MHVKVGQTATNVEKAVAYGCAPHRCLAVMRSAREKLSSF
jgi:hypothetical protein